MRHVSKNARPSRGSDGRAQERPTGEVAHLHSYDITPHIHHLSPPPSHSASTDGPGLAALAYSQRGWAVVPLRPSDKRPLLEWAEFQREKPTPELVAEWWRRWPRANVGIITGAVSGLVVLDVDGEAGREALRGKPLPATPVVVTGRGLHYYYAYPGGELRTCKPAPGLDLKACGSYVVAPPSVHPSGRRYRWGDGVSPWDVALAPLPAWLLERARTASTPRPPEAWAVQIRRGADPGDRHPSLASLAGHLLGKRVDPRVVLELLLAWNEARCRPPKPVDEVVAIVRHLWRKDAAGGGQNG